MEAQKVVVEKKIDGSQAEIWSALTDFAKMREWYFNVSGFEPVVGYEFTFNGESSGVTYVHHCKVTSAIEPDKIAYSWAYEGIPGSSLLTISLRSEGESTVVRLEHTGLESFPQDNPDFSIASFTAGWKYFIEESLVMFIETSA